VGAAEAGVEAAAALEVAVRLGAGSVRSVVARVEQILERFEFRRAVRHLLAPPWLVPRMFPQAVLDLIEAAVRESERRHRGEIRFALEGALEFVPVLRGLTPRSRALEVFSLLRVWDTEANTGVLIYLQLVERHIEIVADRGIAARISQPEWDAICRRMEKAFKAGRYEGGVVAGIEEVSELLVRHFAADADNPAELSDEPVVL
jgi:uncharacterized membrane protein